MKSYEIILLTIFCVIGSGCASTPKSVETQVVEKIKLVRVPTRVTASVSDSPTVQSNLTAPTTAVPAKSESIGWLVLEILTPLIITAILAALLLALLIAQIHSIRKRLRERRDLREKPPEELKPRRRVSATAH